MRKRVEVVYKAPDFPARLEVGEIKSKGIVAGMMTYMIQLDCKPEGELLAFYDDEIRSIQ